MASARFGTPPDAHPGSRVLHLACGNGALTKLLFAAGLQVGLTCELGLELELVCLPCPPARPPMRGLQVDCLLTVTG